MAQSLVRSILQNVDNLCSELILLMVLEVGGVSGLDTPSVVQHLFSRFSQSLIAISYFQIQVRRGLEFADLFYDVSRHPV